MAGEYLKLFVDCLDKYRKLNDAEFGRLIRAALTYKRDGVEMELNGREELLWDGIKLDIDRDNKTYSDIVNLRSEAGKKGAAARWQTDSKNGKCHLPYGKARQKCQDKDKDKDKDKDDKKERSPDGDPKKDAAVAAVIAAYANRINPSMSEMALAGLEGYAQRMGAECCLRAIDIALDEKKATWSYVNGILKAKYQQGVRCIADWDALEQRRAGETDPPRKAKRYREEMIDGRLVAVEVEDA